MNEEYLTLRQPGQISLEIEKSRFIAYASPAADEETARQIIAGIRKQAWDATHNCSAYIVGLQGEAQKADDDGEPSGTAGRPMLEAIKKQALVNAVVVVTRYFGGIKLGAGGLIRAYGRAANEAVTAAGIVRCVLHTAVTVTIDYDLQGMLENSLRTEGYVITDRKFAAQVTMTVLVKTGTEEAFFTRLLDSTAARAKMVVGKMLYVPQTVKQGE